MCSALSSAWPRMYSSSGTRTAASAKVTLVHGSVTFTDYFVLLKTEQGWKIANKAFHAEEH